MRCNVKAAHTSICTHTPTFNAVEQSAAELRVLKPVLQPRLSLMGGAMLYRIKVL